MSSNFDFLVPKNLVKNSIVVSEKIWFEFLYVHDLGQACGNTMPDLPDQVLDNTGQVLF